MWLTLALTILPSLIHAAEQLFGAGTGAAKKQAVTDMATTAINTWQTVSTGGQAKTAQELSPLIGPVIDAIASVMFPSDKVVGSESGTGTVAP